ncbi:MAG: metallophosphoesterase [Flavobacteriaceae bacterium]|jgi:predicted MPP superfamily phosphohydrolase|nr:metallophosphoesterase [Flavobacteriaceae bacterium]MCI5089189.1 metallophosphoesterase [Flavobacteriaceae bacterium]
MRWLVFAALYMGLAWYCFQAFKTSFRNPLFAQMYMASAILVLGFFIFQFTLVSSEFRDMNIYKSYAMGFVGSWFLFSLGVVFFLLFEDVFRLLWAAIMKLINPEQTAALPSRRKFISALALGLAALPFGALLYGMFQGKYRYKVLKYELSFEDLPEAFDGYKITQISDIHSGSFDNATKIQYGIDLINQQASDAIFFTGDMVNNKASEMEPWKEMFGSLQAADGKFSVLGNHDYGDYVAWNSEAEKEANLNRLKSIQKEMGFDLILNEHRYLEKDGQRLALVGVENWGQGGFKKAGDLNKAISGVGSEDFKILLSHDPSHWEFQVKDHPQHFHLTLSGHTHGMQFGIEIPGWIKWSPVKWRYTYWAGIYESMGQYINVNRGFGFLGYPGRVGIWPEITVITLKKAT